MQDYDARCYEEELGRWLSVDPLKDKYPWYTPYQFAGNTPIQAIDLDGLERYHYTRTKYKDGKTILTFTKKEDFTESKFYFNSIFDFGFKEVKNPYQEYVVTQTERKIITRGFDFYEQEYDESVEFSTYEEAKNCTNEDFENTWEDIVFHNIAQGLQNVSEEVRNGHSGGSGGSKSKDIKITVPYKRPSNATTKEQRASVQGKPCVDCGKTDKKMVTDHKKPLVKEYYETGKIDKTKMRSVDSVQPQCPQCSAKQGKQMMKYSKVQKQKHGL